MDANCIQVEYLPQWEQRLQSNYGEILTAVASTTAGKMFRLYLGNKTNTWTVIIVLPTNVACLVFAGDGWQQAEAKKNEL